MANRLMDSEIHELQKYRFGERLDGQFCVADLMDEQFLQDFIQRLSRSIGAPSDKTAASIFIKRYAFIAVLSLYSMTVWNKKINVSLENITMESIEEEKNWLPRFSFEDLTAENWEKGERSKWRIIVLKDLFAKNIDPIIDRLEKAFSISKLVLWENIAVYIFWLYETELKELSNEEVTNDFHYIIFEAEGALFGRYNRNPLQKYYSEKTYLESFAEEVRVRKTCCFTYQLESSSKRCKTCPCSHIARDGRCYDGESICGSVRSFT